MIHRVSPMLVVLALACGTEGAPSPAANADAVAEAEVEVEAKAGGGVAVDADAAADVKANAGAAVVAPTLRAVAEVEAALGRPLRLRAADLDLAALAGLVVRGEVRSAAEIELLLNAPGGAAHRVDVDADAALDYLQVVEVRAEGAVHFEIRAIPSSKLDASLAVLVATLAAIRAEAEGAVQVVATYGAAVEGGAEVRVKHDLKASFDAGAIVVADASAGAFVTWALDAARPVHVSAHLAVADVTVAADGGVRFAGDAAAALSAARLASLRASLAVEVAADAAADARADGKAELDAAARARADAEAELDAAARKKARLEGAIKTGAKAGGGVKVDGGVKVGGSIGGGVKVGGGGKAGAGLKIGK